MYTVTELVPPSGGESYAFGINAQGDVAGTAADEHGVWTAFLYLRAERQMILLASPSGGASVAYDLNDRRPARFHEPARLPQVIGYATAPAGNQHAFLWSKAGSSGAAWETTDLGTLGGKNSWGIAINNAGQIVGGTESGSMILGLPAIVPFIWEAGLMKPITVPAQQPPPLELIEQWALDINDNVPSAEILVVGAGPSGGFAICPTNQNPVKVSAWDNRIWATSFTATNVGHKICGLAGANVSSDGYIGILDLDWNGNGQVRYIQRTASFAPGSQVGPDPIRQRPTTEWGVGGAINHLGQVAATSSWVEASETIVFKGLVSLDGIHANFLQDLTIPATQVDSATDINDDGQIVGYTGGYNSSPDPGVPNPPTPARALLLEPTAPANIKSVIGLLSTILAGIIEGGGGIQLPGGHVGPPTPWWFSLPPSEQNILLGLAVKELAGLVTDPTARLEIERAALTLVTRSAAALAKTAVITMDAAGTPSTPPSLHAKFARSRVATGPNPQTSKKSKKAKK